jgi:ATP-dependent protease ClpP protease subunit
MQPKKLDKRKKEELSYALSDLHSYNVNLGSREIYLHGAKGDSEEPGVEFRMATTFIKNMHLLNNESKENILVHMQSIGGCWDNGMAIFDVIKSSSSPVTILAYSQASSMTGIIFQSAKKRVLMPNCHFLVHHGSIGVEGTHQAVVAAVERDKQALDIMLEVFASRLINGPYFKDKDKSLDYVKKWLDKKIREREDWYMDAQEAVDFGFADGILGERGFKDMSTIRR